MDVFNRRASTGASWTFEPERLEVHEQVLPEEWLTADFFNRLLVTRIIHHQIAIPVPAVQLSFVVPETEQRRLARRYHARRVEFSIRRIAGRHANPRLRCSQ